MPLLSVSFIVVFLYITGEPVAAPEFSGSSVGAVDESHEGISD